ncbi:phytanoyl-CoA dioxygenase family protein [Winogradskyella ouciana]|uniref:Phytanoyl-CoA dioxygenase n=1 Tax=Winogradskyella ouciana TaxID=2608631 RepID=A0A7K1G9K7_9FLAO|nr:phytanoyl-CoA dioxygenase family protein [Winogradskyella ouciana]MTE25863.1 phytanoyl-CoA dioxygenase [Winogradskyella ouciana]
MKVDKYVNELKNLGYSTVEDIYSTREISSIINCIENTVVKDEDPISKNKSIYAIRQLLKVVPELMHYIFNDNLIHILNRLYKSRYFITKAIYFDKPPKSNWFVAYHQDLSISVNKKVELNGYQNWTYKKGQYGVQPPEKILQNTITVRIHLDDTTKDNGALKIIPKSHSKGIIKKESEDLNLKSETICEVRQGGIMLMKPLLFHASNKTTNNKRRRVIHLEFNIMALQKPLEWLEFKKIN